MAEKYEKEHSLLTEQLATAKGLREAAQKWEDEIEVLRASNLELSHHEAELLTDKNRLESAITILTGSATPTGNQWPAASTSMHWMGKHKNKDLERANILCDSQRIRLLEETQRDTASIRVELSNARSRLTLQDAELRSLRRSTPETSPRDPKPSVSTTDGHSDVTISDKRGQEMAICAAFSRLVEPSTVFGDGLSVPGRKPGSTDETVDTTTPSTDIAQLLVAQSKAMTEAIQTAVQEIKDLGAQPTASPFMEPNYENMGMYEEGSAAGNLGHR